MLRIASSSLQRVTTFLLAFVAAAPLRGQSLTGTIRDSTGNALLSGVVVSTFDQRGGVLLRTVSNSNGYSIALSAEVARVQFRRIGFAQVEQTISGTESRRLDVVMRRLPVMLPPVVTRETELCDPQSLPGDALALWNEVRSGLLASAVARASKTARVSLLQYNYTTSGGHDNAQAVIRLTNNAATKAFGAFRSPKAIATLGYVSNLPDRREFLGPDEIVLLDESFLDTHCFGIEPRRRGDDSTLAIHFEPVKNRPVVDIQGTVTLRKNPLEVKSVEYRYTALSPVEMRAKPGGSIYFEAMPIGVSMVSRWQISAVGGATIRRSASLPGDRSNRPNDYDLMIYESGAAIENMAWEGFDPWVATFPSLEGNVKARGAETLGLVARLENTPYATAVDSLGGFVLASVLPGKYVLTVVDTRLEAVGIRRRIRESVEVAPNGTRLRNLGIPNPTELIERACKEDVPHNVALYDMQGPGKVLGRFTFPDGQPRAIPFTIVIGANRQLAGAQPTTLTGTTDESGAFRVCGFPVPRDLTVKTSGPHGAAEATIEVGAVDALQFMSVALRPPG